MPLNSIVPPMRMRSPNGVQPTWTSASRIACFGITLRRARRSCSPCRAPSGSRSPSVARQRRRPRPGGQHEVSASTSPAAVRTCVSRCPCGRARSPRRPPGSRRRRAQHRGEPGGERVRPDVPVLRDVEAGLYDRPTSAGSSSCSSSLGEHVVGKLVAVLAHRLELAQHARGRPRRCARRRPCPACGARTRRRRRASPRRGRRRRGRAARSRPCRGRGRARCSTSRSAAARAPGEAVAAA